MKQRLVRYFLLLCIPMLYAQELRSQNQFADAAGERVEACTDRTLYVCGEKVCFTAIVAGNGATAAKELSMVLYCELITPDGNKILGRKFPLQHNAGQGCVTIPEETVSGIYFLRFYTRFMRNLNPGEYNYIMLKIVNPLKPEVLVSKKMADSATVAGSEKQISVDDERLELKTTKMSFSPREEIRVSINAESGSDTLQGLSLSVIPEAACKYSFFQNLPAVDSAQWALFYPETRGISLSGQLMDNATGKPVAAARVNLSIIGERDIQVVQTDSTGRFYFALPDHVDRKDIFLCADVLPGITPEILINNDFCSKPVNLPAPRFTLNEQEQQTALKLAVNARLNAVFGGDTISSSPVEKETTNSFYGVPSQVLFIDKYIELPTLEEYFTELPVTVKLRKVQGKKQFRFYHSDNEVMEADPLILVDWVAVTDIEKVLKMSPPDIDRIELLDAFYLKGDITYGGIISFISKKNDFAGIDLPTSGTFVNYRFFEKCELPRSPETFPANIPDPRNTVYWNPSVQLNHQGSAEVSFIAPDTPGKYSILLRGMTKSGEIISRSEIILVKNR